MRIILASFLASWLMLLFGAFAGSTDAYEPSALYGILPYYAISMALFSFLLVTWRGNLFHLALLSSAYLATVSGLPYLKYPLLYGSVLDAMFHYSLSQTIVGIGHVPANNPYYGFTTFHSLAAILSMITGLPVIIVFKFEMIILTALVPLAGFWIVSDVLRRPSTIKLAILGGMIAYVPNLLPGPQIMASFLVILSLALLLQFAKIERAPPEQGFMISLFIIMFGVVITHHQTAFFMIFAFVGVGLLLPLIKGTLRTNAIIVQRVELIGLLTLGFAYLWWTYYAGFTDLVRNVFSIITGEPIQFQTTAGRGFLYYGPVTWAYRTVIHYAQRGQLIVWTTLGVLISGVTLALRRKSDVIDADTHALIFSCVLLFLGVYVLFLFVPFFVIGSDRFFRFISFVSPAFIALAIEKLYFFISKIGTRIDLRTIAILRHPAFRSIVAFSLLVLIFIELTSPLLLGEFSPAASSYQSVQNTFFSLHGQTITKIISHVASINQLQVYAPSYPIDSVLREDSVSVLFALYSARQLPSVSLGPPIFLQKVGPAGSYFEAANYYANSTWVEPSMAHLLSLVSTSITYNSGEAFIVNEA